MKAPSANPSTKKKKPGAPEPIDGAQLQAATQSIVESADQQRKDGLTRLAGLQRAKQQVLDRERARVVATHGAKSAPATAAVARVAAAGALGDTLAAGAKLAAAPTPAPAAPATYGVHGRVVHADGRPATGHRVKLFSGDKELSHSELRIVDDNGYFSARVHRDQLRQVAAPDTVFADDGVMAAGLVLRARVFDADDALVHKPEADFLPESGVLDHLIVRLPASAPPPASKSTRKK